MDEKGNETIMADEDIGREGSNTDSRDAIEEKELPETADRIHKPSILERLKAGEGTAEYSGTDRYTENCKEKTRTGVIKDFPSEFSLAGT